MKTDVPERPSHHLAADVRHEGHMVQRFKFRLARRTGVKGSKVRKKRGSMRSIVVCSAIAAGIALTVAAGGIGSRRVAAQTTSARPGGPAGQSVAQHIATFDDLDFNVFTHQKWDEFSKSHSKDIIVHWPDGHQTKGLPKHIEDMKTMFIYAPDTRILVHPVKFGSSEWTSVIGVMEGTFTAPMPVPNGRPIPPTGKAFKLPMNTIGRWNAQGTMDEEWLFWDNATYMSQMGVGK